MKKLVKTIAVLCTAIPVAALSACNALTAVKDENKPTVYQKYAEKLTASFNAMLTGDAYLNDYTSIMFNTQSGEDSSQFVMRLDGDYDFTDATATRIAQKGTLEFFTVTANTETEINTEMRAYLTEDGAYEYQMQEVTGAEKTEVKNFIALAELTPEEIPTLQSTIKLPKGMDGTAEEFLSLYGGAEWFTAEDGTKLQIKSDIAVWDDSFYYMMLEDLGGEGLSVETEQVITLTFDKQGNVLFLEQEVIARATSVTNPPETEEGNGDEEAAPASEESTEESPEDLPEEGTNGETDEETDAPTTVTNEGYYRYYRKTTVKEGSTVKLPTTTELETYKEPAKAPEEAPSEEEKQD